jgi:5-formyltetrahydrofolate cyclo-ligase
MSPDDLVQRKLALRKQILAARAAMPPAQRHLESILLVGRATSHVRFLRARSVLAYAGFGEEVDTSGFLRAVLDAGKTLILPRVEKASGTLGLYEVRNLEQDLLPGQWGIREPRPDANRRVALRAAEFVLTPGLAFDARCNRLGYGKGYYDRLFGDCPGALPFRLALAFDCQRVEAVPVGISDVRLDAVITPSCEYSP